MDDVSGRIAALSAAKRELLLQRLQERRNPLEASSDHYDVVILGGGIAGLTLALQLKNTRPSVKILVIERQRHPVAEAAHKVGESTVEIAAHYLRDILGLEDHLQEQQLRKFGLRMFFSHEDNQDITRRVEIGSTVFPPLATYQLDRGRLENALGQRLRERGICFLDGCKVVRVDVQPQGEAHGVRVLHEGSEREIQARWLVDASGRNTLLKRQLGLTKKVGHTANAVWFRVGYPIDIKTWTTDAAWQARVSQGDRALSTNHLMGPGYWVWLIRLASGSISIGIVTDAKQHRFDEMNSFERALAWLHEHEPQCARAIEEHRDRVQDFRSMKDYSYSCEQVYSGDRWCLTGEAGVFLDPLYSPGIDMIAISNGLVCDLINRSLRGEDIQGRALIHNNLFLSVANIWLSIYEQQYTLMDNAQIMISKIIWDTAFYWGVFGLLYFHDKFCTLVDSPAVASTLSRFALLSNRVQAFFREWHAIDQATCSTSFVDLYAPLNFMVRLHTGMAADLSPSEFEGQFAANLRLFEQLAGQLISTVIEVHANQYENQAVLRQIQRWQTEPLLAEWIARYRREGRVNPTSAGWIALAPGQAERSERLAGQEVGR